MAHTHTIHFIKTRQRRTRTPNQGCPKSRNYNNFLALGKNHWSNEKKMVNLTSELNYFQIREEATILKSFVFSCLIVDTPE